MCIVIAVCCLVVIGFIIGGFIAYKKYKQDKRKSCHDILLQSKGEAKTNAQAIGRIQGRCATRLPISPIGLALAINRGAGVRVDR